MAITRFIKHLIIAAGSKQLAAKYLMDNLIISKEGAYRRLRSSTTFSTEELFKIASHWNISLDNLLEISNSADSLRFDYTPYQ